MIVSKSSVGIFSVSVVILRVFFGFSERLCGHLLPQSLCGTVMNF